MKLDKAALYNPENSDGRPVGSGCFGVVYHKLLPPEVRIPATWEFCVLRRGR